MSRGQTQEIERLRKINRLKEYAETRYNLGLKYGDQGDFRSAVKTFNEALKFDPLNTQYLSIRAMAKCQIEDYRGAVEDYSKVIELKPGNKDAYSYRSRARDLVGDYDGAESDRIRARLVIK